MRTRTLVLALVLFASVAGLAACFGGPNLNNGDLICSCGNTCPHDFVCGADEHCWRTDNPQTCDEVAEGKCLWPNFCLPLKCGELTHCVTPDAVKRLPRCDGFTYERTVPMSCGDGGQ